MPLKMKFYKPILVIFLFIYSSLTYSAIISFDDNLFGSVYVNQGSIVNRGFDISSTLDSNALYNNPYVVNNAYVDFSFSDDPTDALSAEVLTGRNILTVSAYGERYNAWIEGIWHSSYSIRYGTVEYQSYRNYETESAYINGGIVTASSLMGGQDTQINRDNVWHFDFTCSGCNYHYTIESQIIHERISNYGGSWSYRYYLTPSEIAGLSGTGIYNYSVTGRNGDLFFDNAVLYADLTENPAPVPVPTAAYLFGSGLLGLIGAARRKKAA